MAAKSEVEPCVGAGRGESKKIRPAAAGDLSSCEKEEVG
jgi:hypothetical protein